MTEPDLAATVRAARDAGDFATALSISLQVWRSSRSPVVSAVVESLDGPAIDAWGPPKARTKDAFHDKWMAVAQGDVNDSVATGWLASTLATKLPVAGDRFGLLRDDYAETKYAALFARLEQLGRRPADPRIAAALVTQIIKAPYSAWFVGAQPIYTPMITLLEQTADPSQIPRLEQLIARPRAKRSLDREYFAQTLPPLIEQLSRVEVAGVADGWSDLVARKRAVAAPDGRTAEQLLVAIVEDVEDDMPRRVYADLLIEAGDPRGEFIQLQLDQASGQTTDASLKRASGLLRKHQQEWLGPDLSLVLKGVEFKRGFLHKAELAQNAAADAASWKRAASAPALGTARRLQKGRCNAVHFEAFITSTACPNLDDVEAPNKKVLDALLELTLPRRIRTLRLTAAPTSGQLARLADNPVFDELTELMVPWASGPKLDKRIGALARVGLLDRLTELRLGMSFRQQMDRSGPPLERWPDVPEGLKLTLASHWGRARVLRRADVRSD